MIEVPPIKEPGAPLNDIKSERRLKVLLCCVKELIFRLMLETWKHLLHNYFPVSDSTTRHRELYFDGKNIKREHMTWCIGNVQRVLWLTSSTFFRRVVASTRGTHRNQMRLPCILLSCAFDGISVRMEGRAANDMLSRMDNKTGRGSGPISTKFVFTYPYVDTNGSILLLSKRYSSEIGLLFVEVAHRINRS